MLINWNKLREEFFQECTDPPLNSGRNAGTRPINMNAHNLFEWFKKKIENNETNQINKKHE